MVTKLLTDLQAALGASGDALMEGLGTPPSDLEGLLTFVNGLPTALEAAGAELSSAGEALVKKAGEDLQKCLPTPSTGGGSQTTPPTKSSGYYTPPAQQPAFQYTNCDEARAHGAAPVYSGQPGYGSHLDSDYDGVGCEETAAPVAQPVTYSGDGGKLAYTGVATEPLLAWGAALLASGAWLILSGRRRA